MTRSVHVLLCLSLGSGCSLLFDDMAVDGESAGEQPELRYAFEGGDDTNLTSTGREPLDLQTFGVARIANGALDLSEGSDDETALAVTVAPLDETISRCQLAGELTLALWITAASASPIQGLPARIVSLEASEGEDANFMLGQGRGSGSSDGFDSFISFRTGSGATEEFVDAEVSGLLEGEPIWVAVVLDTNTEPSASVAFVVDGVLSRFEKSVPMASWSLDYNLRIGNRNKGDRQWTGLVHHFELYCRALSSEELEKLRIATEPQGS